MTTRKKKRNESGGGGFIKKVSSLFNLDSVRLHRFFPEFLPNKKKVVFVESKLKLLENL